QVNEAEEAADDAVRLVIAKQKVLGEIQHEQRAHAVEAESLPHLDREQSGKLAGMAEPRLLIGRLNMRDVGRGRCLRPGRVDHILSPRAGGRGRSELVTSNSPV